MTELVQASPLPEAAPSAPATTNQEPKKSEKKKKHKRRGNKSLLPGVHRIVHDQALALKAKNPKAKAVTISSRALQVLSRMTADFAQKLAEESRRTSGKRLRTNEKGIVYALRVLTRQSSRVNSNGRGPTLGSTIEAGASRHMSQYEASIAAMPKK